MKIAGYVSEESDEALGHLTKSFDRMCEQEGRVRTTELARVGAVNWMGITVFRYEAEATTH
jgi:hypothetical protein